MVDFNLFWILWLFCLITKIYTYPFLYRIILFYSNRSRKFSSKELPDAWVGKIFSEFMHIGGSVVKPLKPLFHALKVPYYSIVSRVWFNQINGFNPLPI